MEPDVKKALEELQGLRDWAAGGDRVHAEDIQAVINILNPQKPPLPEEPDHDHKGHWKAEDTEIYVLVDDIAYPASKAPKGTPERKKALKVVELVHERIADRRADFANKVSRQLVDRYGVIVFEDLNIKGMMENHNLAKSIGDVAWNMLVKATENKAAYAGSKVVLVDPRQTSQMCSRCGLIVKKDLSERVHSCPECGLSMDRDLNAAINILRLGMQSLRKCDRSPVL